MADFAQGAQAGHFCLFCSGQSSGWPSQSGSRGPAAGYGSYKRRSDASSGNQGERWHWPAMPPGPACRDSPSLLGWPRRPRRMGQPAQVRACAGTCRWAFRRRRPPAYLLRWKAPGAPARAALMHAPAPGAAPRLRVPLLQAYCMSGVTPRRARHDLTSRRTTGHHCCDHHCAVGDDSDEQGLHCSSLRDALVCPL